MRGEPYDASAAYGHRFNEDIAAYIDDRPVDEAMLARVTRLPTEPAADLVFVIWPHFDGESDEFELTDLSGLDRLPALAELFAEVHREADLAVVARCAHLTSVSLDCRVPLDLSPLAAARGLRTLELLRAENVADLAALRSLPELATLHLHGDPQALDLRPLLDMPALSSFARLRTAFAEGTNPAALAFGDDALVLAALFVRGIAVATR
ncbi:hypothetical protein SAMN02745121_06119 [Nannocystis exedens]|uniref:DUF6892 domain-containing protein n=1 Tax=Nannocystis exedens TaxID=54 RepID=A0A1I2EKF5_9BACT|nr:hypothetical protein [Nannocystis exedens]PCC73961.1 hypothetical protein NAEX_07050 [Nannocystis exedens]SFE93594.1 hypothetical protein SAMN02745121_06119 [Nannocystis exedens]